MDRGTFVSHAEAEATTLAEALERYVLEITRPRNSPQPSGNLAASRSLGGLPLARRPARLDARRRYRSLYPRPSPPTPGTGQPAGGGTPYAWTWPSPSHLFNTAHTARGRGSLTNLVASREGPAPEAPGPAWPPACGRQRLRRRMASAPIRDRARSRSAARTQAASENSNTATCPILPYQMLDTPSPSTPLSTAFVDTGLPIRPMACCP